jgi:hypothetical protein
MSIQQIMEALVAGEIDEPKARNLLYDLFQRLGSGNPAGEVEATIDAIEAFGGTPPPVPTATPPPMPGGELFGKTRGDLLSDIAKTAGGRFQQFGGFLGEQLAKEPVSGVFRNFLENQFGALQNQFIQKQALGQFPPQLGQEQSPFQQFLPGAQVEDMAARRALLSRVVPFLTPGSVIPDAARGLTEFLSDPNDPNQSRAFSMALGSVLPGVPGAFRDPFRNFAQRQFDKWQSTTPDLPFLPQFVKGGFKF